MSERYNGRPPQTRVIRAGTALHRISGTGSPYPPNSFNRSGIRALGDSLQGRFEPIDDSHGGYLYVALSLSGAVAEGILRDIPIPRSGIVRRKRLADKTHTKMVLGRDVTVASLLDGDLRWLRGLVLHEPLSGAHGQVGTKSRVVMQMGKQKIECTETITRREPADLRGIPTGSVVHFDREIVGEGMWSAVRDRLTEAGPEMTLWVSESEYRFSGLLMRLVGLLMPGAFRKQSQQHMQDFKAFAEQGKDVRESKD